MNISPKVQKIIDWRESFSILPDDYFFEIVRMYLGEVKTPYNKQKLIEELGAFIRKDENRRNIIALLDSNDIKLLSAVWMLPSCDEKKLESFLEPQFSLAAVYERVANLSERLVLYRVADKKSGNVQIKINPLLEDELSSMLGMNALVSSSENFTPLELDSVSFSLSNEFFAVLVSYLVTNKKLCRSDGALKKHPAEELKNIFGSDRTAVIETLVRSMTNLSLLADSDSGLEIKWNVLSQFAGLSFQNRIAYLCAAVTRFSRRTLIMYAQLLTDALYSVQKKYVTRADLKKIIFVLKEKTGGHELFGAGRVSELLRRAQSLQDDTSLSDSGISDLVIDNAVKFGVLEVAGKNEQGEDLFKVSEQFINPQQSEGESVQPLSVDAAFSVSVMPGASLTQLLELVKFADAVQFDTVSAFTVSRSSVMRGFGLGMNAEKIISVLQKMSPYPVPQNLCVSVEEWYSSFNSAGLYKGYILRIPPESEKAVLKNPNFAPFVRETIAPGIILLDFDCDETACRIIQKAGLDFVSGIKSEPQKQDPAGFSEIYCGGSYTDIFSAQKASQTSSENSAALVIEQLKEVLSSMKMSAEQKECLLERIERRVIVNPVQLRAESVRFEVLEAGGMDYTGKIHVIESAVQGGSLLEIELEDSPVPLIGRPVHLNKISGGAELYLATTASDEPLVISVSAAVRVKKIRGSAFIAKECGRS